MAQPKTLLVNDPDFKWAKTQIQGGHLPPEVTAEFLFCIFFPDKAKQWAQDNLLIRESMQKVKTLEELHSIDISPYQGGKVAKNVYQILGAQANSDWKDLRTHYRQEIRRVHPDARPKNLSPEEAYLYDQRTVQLNEAWSVIDSQEKLERYNQHLREVEVAVATGTGPSYTSPSQPAYYQPPTSPSTQEIVPIVPETHYAGYSAPGIKPLAAPKQQGTPITGQIGSSLGQTALKTGVKKAGEKTAQTLALKAAGSTAAKVAASNAIPVIGQAITIAALAASIINKMKKELAALPFTLAGNFGALANTLPNALVGMAKTAIIVTVCALLGIVVFIAFTALVINNGAYVVPPGSLTGYTPIGGQPPSPTRSLYMDITKTATPGGQLPNSSVTTADGLSVTYTVTIRATRGTLTGIVFSDQCSVITGNPTQPQCPPTLNTNNQPFTLTPPSQVDVATPYVLTYKRIYRGTQFQDSLITDTFIVQAVAPDGTGNTTAAASATLVIGTPPTGCLTFDTTWDVNPTVQGYKQSMIQAVQIAMAHHPQYIAKICAVRSSVILQYGGNRGTQNGACPDACIFYEHLFTDPSLNFSSSKVYVLVHELAHNLNWARPLLLTQFQNTVLCQSVPGGSAPTPCEGYLPLYGPSHNGSVNQYEDFAETVAYYVMANAPFGGICRTATYNGQTIRFCYDDIRTQFPLHNCFATNVLFTANERPDLVRSCAGY